MPFLFIFRNKSNKNSIFLEYYLALSAVKGPKGQALMIICIRALFFLQAFSIYTFIIGLGIDFHESQFQQKELSFPFFCYMARAK
jgi:hypothetical protein